RHNRLVAASPTRRSSDLEHRHLDREGDEEREEQPGLLGGGQRQLHEVGDLPAATFHVEVDQPHQHEYRTEEGVEEELHGRVHAADRKSTRLNSSHVKISY